MGCGCGGTQTTVWVFTPPNGQPQVYNKEIQAKVAKVRAGGGTIVARPA